VVAYLAGCIVIGILASRKVLKSRDEYWVAGRRIGSIVNAMAIMAALASGGSIIGVMGAWVTAVGFPTPWLYSPEPWQVFLWLRFS